jgi:hypothetical protein
MVDRNTGGPQSVVLAGRALFIHVDHSNIDCSDARQIVTRAVENGHLLRWSDTDGDGDGDANGDTDTDSESEGRTRYAVTSAGIAETPRVSPPIYDERDREGLERVLRTEVGRDAPDKSVVGWANQRLAALDALEGSDE